MTFVSYDQPLFKISSHLALKVLNPIPSQWLLKRNSNHMNSSNFSKLRLDLNEFLKSFSKFLTEEQKDNSSFQLSKLQIWLFSIWVSSLFEYDQLWFYQFDLRILWFFYQEFLWQHLIKHPTQKNKQTHISSH